MLTVLTLTGNFLLANSPDCDSVKVKNLIDLSVKNIINFDKSKNYIDESLLLTNNKDCNVWHAKALANKAYLFYFYQSLDTAQDYFEQALKIFKDENNTEDVLNVVDWIANIHYMKYEFKRSIEYCSYGLSFNDSAASNLVKANLYMTMGSCYDEMGELDKAINTYLLAEEIYEKDNDKSGLISIYINISIIYIQNKNYSPAIEYLEKTLEIAEKIDDLDAVSICYNNLGEIYHLQNDNEKALDFYLKSLAMDQQQGDQEGVAIGYNNVGDTYIELGDTVMAMSYFEKCRKMGMENSFPILATVEVKIAKVMLKQGKLNNALNSALLSLEYAKQYSGIKDIISSYYILNQIYRELGDYRKAYYYFEKFNQLDDSLNTIAQSQYIDELTTLYSLDKQQLEIDELQEQTRISKQTRQILIFVVVIVSGLIVILVVVNLVMRRSRRIAQRSTLYYEKILEGSEDYIFVVGANGRTKYISPSYNSKIGRPVSERIGADTFEFIHPDDVKIVRLNFEKLVKGKKIASLDFRMKISTGEYIFVHAVGQNYLNDGLIEGILVNFWDITQRVNSEKVIKDSERRFRQIFNAFPDIYFQTTMNGVLLELTPSVHKISGYTREELINQRTNLGDIISAGWEKILSDLEKELEVHDIDIEIIKKDGSTLNCSLSAEVILSEKSAPASIKGVIRDISIRIKNQQKINQSQKELKEANASKEKLFSIIAHDLIGPIGTNKSIIDLIVSQVKSLTNEEVISLIASLKPSLDATFALIENLLSWARIQQDRLIPNIEKVSLVNLVSMIISVLRGQANKKSIELVFEYKSDSIIMADRNQLDIAIRNLVSNAIKFSDPSSSVIITLEQDVDNVILRIIDSGVGMKQVEIDNLLDKNELIEVRRGTDNEKGTGFGLLIVKEFVKNNKGELSALSAPSDGTTFIIRFSKADTLLQNN